MQELQLLSKGFGRLGHLGCLNMRWQGGVDSEYELACTNSEARMVRLRSSPPLGPSPTNRDCRDLGTRPAYSSPRDIPTYDHSGWRVLNGHGDAGSSCRQTEIIPYLGALKREATKRLQADINEHINPHRGMARVDPSPIGCSHPNTPCAGTSCVFPTKVNESAFSQSLLCEKHLGCYSLACRQQQEDQA